ncbi:MAG: hypothetical protein KGJ43_04070 [Acidobacteriota bacterium]|nr:hypothetical protein [Acidobacteriota bacterium]
MASATSIHPIQARRSRVRQLSVAHAADVASYWTIIAATYTTFGFLFYYSAKEKLFDDSGTMPASLAKTFHGSLIASFPGTNTAWLLLGLLEGLVFIVIAASLLSGEMLAGRRKPILLSGLGLSMLSFGVMSFAENMVAQFSTVAELFGYLSGTAVLIVLLLLMPPYRPANWLSSLTQRAERRA